MNGWLELGNRIARVRCRISCMRYLHHGGRDGWDSSSVKADKGGWYTRRTLFADMARRDKLP